MDPYNPMTDESVFHSNADWVEFYGDVVEEDPPRILEPLCEPVSRSTFVDSNHTPKYIIRRSHTGILLFVCNEVIEALSKRHNTVESSNLGSELVAISISRDMIVELRIKIYCDNQGVEKEHERSRIYV